MSDARVKIYTDGACRGNPGPGGWGALVVRADRERELWGGEARTTNNRMELTAAIRALESVEEGTQIDLYTDSRYLRDGVTEWIAAWKRNGWNTVSRRPVKNRDLWERLDALAGRHRVRWHWVRGHTGHAGNERADVLAHRGLDEGLA